MYEYVRAVEKNNALRFCRANGIGKFCETSAVEGNRVDSIFKFAANQLYETRNTKSTQRL